eukprot:TRINITY_DN23791_c0_g1_i1.p1 TRINITY_DN23791_c0_g1~~TRINITY_DN23791_c0_g1_i1.p1  ORF type:complete len:300 (+),score=121.55 TRINITY_DN23791_c0_g1_i1:90-989(+)
MAEAPAGQNNAVAAAVGLAVLFGMLGVLVFLMMRTGSDTNAEKQDEARTAKQQEKSGRKRGALAGMQRGAARAAAAGDAAAGEEDDGPVDEKEAKRQERAEQAAANRRAQQEAADAKAQKQSKYKNKLEEKEAARLAKEEEERLAQEEKEKKEQEEFEQWKTMFAVDASGEAEGSGGSENAVEQFIDYVKVRKVVNLEDLAAEFRMRTSSVINRLESLQKLDRISGIFDDRGKYIYITAEEQAAVADWLQKRGRINRSDLVAACNRIVRLNPTEEDKAKLEKEALDAAADLEGEADAGS